MQLLSNGAPLYEIVQKFLASEEFRCKGPVGIVYEPPPANAIEIELSPSQKQYLWQHVTSIWNKLGKDEPYWSVMEEDRFRVANISHEDAIDCFYESGRFDIDRAERFLVRNGCRLPQTGFCLDYGCGLGRTTLWLARRCERVLAVDVSPAHLDLAREALAARGVRNVEFRLLRSPHDLAALRGFDFFHSLLVLQHNPPPVIADILSMAFAGLNPGGAALFQVPTFGMDYSWHIDTYVRETVPYQQAEMHVLPQSVIFDLAVNAGCIPMEVAYDFYSGMPNWISNTFVFFKPGAASPLPVSGRQGPAR